MITQIRRKFQGESLRYAMWVILFALAAGYLLPLLVKESRGGWAIRINGSEISDVEFAHQAAFEQDRVARIREQYGQYADLLFQSQGMSLDPRSLAYDYLVDQELLAQVGRKLGIQISPSYLQEKMADPMFVMRDPALSQLIPPYAFDRAGGINMEILQMHLQRIGMSHAEFEHAFEKAITKHIVFDILRSTVYIPDFDVMQRYITEYVGKKFAIVSITVENLIKDAKKQPVTDAELEQFFNLENTKNKRYLVSEKRSGIVWTFKADSYGAVPSQEAIESYYEKNKMKMYVDEPAKISVRRMVVPFTNPADRASAQAQAEKLHQELVATPSLFAQKGQTVPLFAKGASKYGPEFEKAAFTLASDGDISPVFETKEGFEIVQRVERKARTFKSLNAVSNEIKSTLAQRKFQDAFTDDMKRIARSGNAKQELEKLAKAKNATSRTLESVGKDASAEASKLFGLKKDGITFNVEKGTGHAIELTGVQASYVPELSTIRTQVMNDLYEHRARKKLAALLEDGKRKATNNTIAELAHLTGGSVEHTGWLMSKKRDGLEALEKKEVPVREMLQMEKKGSLLVHEAGNAGFIIRLEDIEPVNHADFDAKKATIRANLENERTGAQIMGFVASLARIATIEINETLMQHLA